MSAWSSLADVLGAWWAKPELQSVNVLPARTTFEVYSDTDAARTDTDPWRRPLDKD